MCSFTRQEQAADGLKAVAWKPELRIMFGQQGGFRVKGLGFRGFSIYLETGLRGFARRRLRVHLYGLEK